MQIIKDRRFHGKQGICIGADPKNLLRTGKSTGGYSMCLDPQTQYHRRDISADADGSANS